MSTGNIENNFVKDLIHLKRTRNNFQMVIMKVIVDCSDDDDEDIHATVSSSSHSNSMIDFNPRDLPYFSNEPPGIGVLLDYMLVDWLFPVSMMIRTRNGRSLLRSYSSDVQRVLECTLNSTLSHDHFRFLISAVWGRRAELFYDARDNEYPYIPHRYTTDFMAPHTRGDANRFYTRNLHEYDVYNPLVSRSYVDRILHIHGSNQSYYNQLDVFSRYNANGMSASDYYLESRIDQFYRVIFFFKELQARGIRYDVDDVYPRALPYNIVPEYVQEMFTDDDVYHNFLLTRRNNLLNRGIDHEITRNLARRHRTYEEDLLVATRVMGFLNFARTKTTTSTTTTTTTTTTTKAPPKASDQSKKGSVCVNNHGKHFTKQRREFFNSCCENGYDNSNTMENQRFIDSYCLEQKNNSFARNILSICSMITSSQKNKYNAYILSNTNINQLIPSNEKATTLMKILLGILRVSSRAHYNELR